MSGYTSMVQEVVEGLSRRGHSIEDRGPDWVLVEDENGQRFKISVSNEGSTPLDSPAPADVPAPVPPPVDALLKLIDRAAHCNTCDNPSINPVDEGEIETTARALWATGVEEGRRQRDAEIHTNVLTSARLAAAEAGFGMVPESVTVSYLTPDIRAVTLIEAYWKLRDHATGLRSTEVYRKASERKEGTLGESPAFQRYRWLEATARGIEDGAHDLAELLGVEEHEIERPAVDHG